MAMEKWTFSAFWKCIEEGIFPFPCQWNPEWNRLIIHQFHQQLLHRVSQPHLWRKKPSSLECISFTSTQVKRNTRRSQRFDPKCFLKKKTSHTQAPVIVQSEHTCNDFRVSKKNPQITAVGIAAVMRQGKKRHAWVIRNYPITNQTS